MAEHTAVAEAAWELVRPDGTLDRRVSAAHLAEREPTVADESAAWRRFGRDKTQSLVDQALGWRLVLQSSCGGTS